MGAAAYEVATFGHWDVGFSIMNSVVLTAAIVAGGVAYAIAQTIFRADELKAVRNRLLRRRKSA